MTESRTLSISIRRPSAEVYDYLASPENFPRWSAFITEMKRGAKPDTWIARTTAAEVTIRFEPRNQLGVLDHHVNTPTGETVFVPLRVVANGADGSDVLFTVFRSPAMNDDQFAEDLGMVSKDLASLKRVLETAAAS